MKAFELNGVQVQNNQAAFEWGRRCAHDLAAVQAIYQAPQVIEFVRKPSLDAMVQARVEFLTGYQNAAYATQYRAFVDKVRAAEAPLGGTMLGEAVARCLFKLMAYKDEYEVARLHTDRAFTDRIASMFEGEFRIVHHLAQVAHRCRRHAVLLQQRHHLAHRRRAGGAGFGDRCSNRSTQFIFAHLDREVRRKHGDFCALLRHQIGAPAGLELADRILALLDQLLDDREHDGVAGLDAFVDFALLDGRQQHPDGGETLGIASAHRRLHVLGDPVLQSHVPRHVLVDCK